MASFIKGEIEPTIAFFGYGIIGPILIYVAQNIALAILVPIVGMDNSLLIYLAVYVFGASIWIYLTIGIFRSLLNVGSVPLKYVSLIILVIWSLLLLVGQLAAILIPTFVKNA